MLIIVYLFKRRDVRTIIMAKELLIELSVTRMLCHRRECRKPPISRNNARPYTESCQEHLIPPRGRNLLLEREIVFGLADV